MKMLKIWLLLSLIPIITHAATCPACPVGGIWSDWTTTETCPTTCGGCSQISYTRTCLSTAMTNCPCTGVTSKRMVCNTQACNWPRFNATGMNCCTGTPTTIRNWVHCAPLPDNYTLPCCPDTGYWSNWSGWSKVANQVAWQRTRTCLSGGYSCPCKGDSVFLTTTCPCTPVEVITPEMNTCAQAGSEHDNPFSVRKPIFMSPSCETVLVLESSNFRNNFFTLIGSTQKCEGSVGWIDNTGTCRQGNILLDGADHVGSSGQSVKATLTCNLNTLRFEGNVFGVSMSNVVAFAQYY